MLETLEEPAMALVAPAVATGRGPAFLRLPAYRRLWLSGTLYYMAYWVEIVTTGWVVLQLSGSAFDVGLVGFCRMLPMLALGLFIGALADRVAPTTVLLVAQAIGLIAATTLASLAILGQLSLLPICLLCAVLGCVWASDFPTRRALVAGIVATETTGSAMSLEAMTMQGSKLTATICGGALLALGGPRLAYALLALIYVGGVVASVRLRRMAPTGPPARRLPLLRLRSSGFGSVLRLPSVRAALIVTVLMNLLVFPYQQLIPVVARDILSVGPQRMGLLAGADGLGAIVVAGALVLRARRSRSGRYFAGGSLVGAGLVALLGLSHHYPLSVALQILAGAAFGAFSSMQPALIVNAVAPEQRARALGALAMAIGVTPFGILLSGALSSAIGPSLTLTGTTTVAIFLMLTLHLRNRALVGGAD